MTSTQQNLVTHALPNPEILPAATRYLERGAVFEVHNRYLRLVIAGLVFVLVVFGAVFFKLSRSFADLRPLVIRISDVGQATAVSYASMEYQPREAEIRYFLQNFVHDYYGRDHATARDAFARSLYFLSPERAKELVGQETLTKSVSKFAQSADDNVLIEVRNVSIEDLRTPPYRATVDFEKIHQAVGTGQETHREKYTAHFVFGLADHVSNNFVPVNPLGLIISYFREDQAF